MLSGCIDPHLYPLPLPSHLTLEPALCMDHFGKWPNPPLASVRQQVVYRSHSLGMNFMASLTMTILAEIGNNTDNILGPWPAVSFTLRKWIKCSRHWPPGGGYYQSCNTLDLPVLETSYQTASAIQITFICFYHRQDKGFVADFLRCGTTYCNFY